MIARIYVRKKVQGGLAFDYKFTGTPPPIYSLVEVPFAKNKVMGVVDSVMPKSTFAVKHILRILSKSSVFTRDQIRLAKLMSDYYLSSFSEVIFSFLPNLNLRDLKSLGATNIIHKNTQGEIHQIIASKSERVEYFSQVLFRDKSQKGQTVIVLPTIKQINETTLLLKKFLPRKSVIVWHSQLHKKDKAIIWQKILLGENLIIVGTRHSLFLPYTYLKNIFIDDPLNFAYQDDQAPYYNAYTVARILTKISHSNLFIGSDTPDTLSFVGILRKSVILTELKSNLRIKLLPSFSNKIVENQRDLRKQVESKKKILVIGNWRENYRYFCNDCKKTVLCTNCSGELFMGQNSMCTKCSSINLSLSCKICSGTNIKKLGLDRALFQKNFDDIFFHFKKNFSYLTWGELEKSNQSFDIALIPYFNSMLNLPYLRSRQKLFRRVRGLRSSGVENIYIYGENLEDNEFVKQLRCNDWKGFLSEELKERKELNLPPFSRSFLVWSKDKSTEHNLENLNRWCKKINNRKDIKFLPVPENQGLLILVDRRKVKDFAKSVSEVNQGNIHLCADPPEFS